jgi:hypothetical protein
LRQALYHGQASLATGLVLGVLAVTAACGGGVAAAGPAPASAPAAAPAPVVSLDAVAPRFVPGEAMTFEVTFRGIEGGRARVAVGAPTLVDGRRVLALRASAESAGLVATFKEMRDDLTTWIDADSALPLRTESDANITGKAVQVKAVFAADRASAELEITRGEKTRTVKRVLPPAEVYDPLGALLVMRGLDAPDGARAVFYTLGGQRLWRTELTVAGREELRGPLGRFACVRLEGVSTRLATNLKDDTRKPPRRFSVWISDDARRLPLRITAHTELGDVNVIATSYEAPAP